MFCKVPIKILDMFIFLKLRIIIALSTSCNVWFPYKLMTIVRLQGTGFVGGEREVQLVLKINDSGVDKKD